MREYVKLAILAQYPDYDFDRYYFEFGDIVKTTNGAIIFTIYSAIEYIEAFVIKPSFGFRKHQILRVRYNDLPYYRKGEFKSLDMKINKKIKWSVGDIVINPKDNSTLLLVEEVKPHSFYAYVIRSINNLYNGTKVYVENPYMAYMTNV